MLIVFDIGNTNIVAGVFDDKKLVHKFKINSDINLKIDELIKILQEKTSGYKFDMCIISSVVNGLDKTLKMACEKLFDTNIILLDSSFSEFKFNVENPQTVGIDRLINTYCIYKKYGKAAIVVDAGTAITIDVISSKGEFLGGVIMSGIKMKLNSLSQNTSKLPLLELSLPCKAIGKNTEEAMISGAVIGSSKAIEVLIKKIKTELNTQEILIVLTGGDCLLIKDFIDEKIDLIEPNLTLKGLNTIGKELETKFTCQINS